jgi:hypothetical protein
MDGEVLWLDSPMHFAVQPKSLNVLAPADPASSSDATPEPIPERA